MILRQQFFEAQAEKVRRGTLSTFHYFRESKNFMHRKGM